MNNKELIEKINSIPWDEGLVVDTLKINRAGLIQLIEQLDEPQKVTIPQYVADWIEECKGKDETLYYALDRTPPQEVDSWFCEDEVRQQNTFARAWLDGYTVEEKRYTVKIKAILGQYLERYYLNNEELTPQFKRTQLKEGDVLPTFTRKELEDAGFGWVFDCPGIEIEEVKDDTN